MQLGAMQDWSLRVTRFIDHAAREHGNREIVSRWADGSETRTTWAGIRHDAMRMAQKLAKLGIKPGDRIATLAMNHHRHLVTWYGAVGVGGVLHTINPRLFDDQLDYIGRNVMRRIEQVVGHARSFCALRQGAELERPELRAEGRH